VVAVALAAVATAVIYVQIVNSVQPLSQGGLSMWYFPQDRDHQVYTRTVAVTQVATPERYGQEQGFVVGIVNPTDWTQTVVGVDPRWMAFSFEPPRVAVGSDGTANTGGWDSKIRWSVPGDIPPHSQRLLLVLWTSDLCQVAGGAAATWDLSLKVRVGMITRTEDIPLDQAWALTGNKSSVCRLPG
jgi:hypothetical protein